MRKMLALTLALLLWTAAAFAWPAAWSGDGKQFIVLRQFDFYGLDVEERLYEDGALARLVEGRPFAVEPTPDDPCAPYWKDEGMLAPDKGDDRELPPSLWRAPDWRLIQSTDPVCGTPA